MAALSLAPRCYAQRPRRASPAKSGMGRIFASSLRAFFLCWHVALVLLDFAAL